MHNIILLILCLAIGVALRRFGRVPDNAHTTLNTFIIHVAFPALILGQVHTPISSRNCSCRYSCPG
jgi:predicted permease